MKCNVANTSSTTAYTGDENDSMNLSNTVQLKLHQVASRWAQISTHDQLFCPFILSNIFNFLVFSKRDHSTGTSTLHGLLNLLPYKSIRTEFFERSEFI